MIDRLKATGKNAKSKFYPKGSIIQGDGETCQHLFYIKQGLLRAYSIDEKGKEYIYLFTPENWLIGDIQALEFHRPSKLFIDAIEDSEVVALNYYEFFDLDLTIQDYKNEIKMLLRRVAMLQTRVLMLMSQPAAVRYEDFINTYPDLLNRIPQRMIASYLGITPQALSQIRRDRLKK